jgi:hypothetical protein
MEPVIYHQHHRGLLGSMHGTDIVGGIADEPIWSFDRVAWLD